MKRPLRRAPSPDSAQLARDLAHVGQEVEALKASIAELMMARAAAPAEMILVIFMAVSRSLKTWAISRE